MKKILLYVITGICVLTLGACDFKEDRVFGETPDARLQKVLSEYSEALVSAPSGWLFAINTGVSGGYQLYMSFNNRDRVVMLCDMDATFATDTATSAVPNESSYQLKALQMPSLIFDTYNYLHLMVDPQGAINGGTSGVGLKSDFEFDILSFDSGIFTLRGTFNKCQAYLRRATPEEAEAAVNGMLKKVFIRLEEYNKTAGNPVVEIDGTNISVATTGRTTTFKWLAEDQTELTASTGSWMALTADPQTPADIAFFTPLDVLGKKIVGLVWNGTAYDAVDAAGEVYTSPL